MWKVVSFQNLRRYATLWAALALLALLGLFLVTNSLLTMGSARFATQKNSQGETRRVTVGKKKTIGKLSVKEVYRRANGDLYLKLNEELQVKTKLGWDENGNPMWVGDGYTEPLDPNEEVEVVE